MAHLLNIVVTFFKPFQIDSPDVATVLLNITGTINYSREQLFFSNPFIILQIMYIIYDILPHIIHCLQLNAKITEYYFKKCCIYVPELGGQLRQTEVRRRRRSKTSTRATAVDETHHVGTWSIKMYRLITYKWIIAVVNIYSNADPFVSWNNWAYNLPILVAYEYRQVIGLLVVSTDEVVAYKARFPALRMQRKQRTVQNTPHKRKCV